MVYNARLTIMSMKIYTRDDLHRNVLKDAQIGILGFGNQGHAQAMNLRDSGVVPVVGTRRGGTGWERAVRAGFESVGIGEATSRSDVVVMLLPDEVQPQVFRDEIGPSLRPGTTIIFPHGFTVAFEAMEIPEGHDVVLVAPKGQGHFLRKMYQEGNGLPCLIGIETDASGEAFARALSYADLIGCLSAGAIRTSFREEAITDLFGEQVVLCGGVPELVKRAFDCLVERGYSPEVAYIECLHELKIITDLMYQGGIKYMRDRISGTAAWGSFKTGGRVIDDRVYETMKEVLDDIESGRFAEGWLEQAESGQRELRTLMREESTHGSESAGRKVRRLMPFLNEESDDQ